MKQEEMILNYMNMNGSITVRECVTELGCTELRKRISDLKRAGYDIRSVWETGENRYGQKVKFKRYYLG